MQTAPYDGLATWDQHKYGHQLLHLHVTRKNLQLLTNNLPYLEKRTIVTQFVQEVVCAQ